MSRVHVGLGSKIGQRRTGNFLRTDPQLSPQPEDEEKLQP